MIRTLIIELDAPTTDRIYPLFKASNYRFNVLGRCQNLEDAKTVLKICRPDLAIIGFNTEERNIADFLGKYGNQNLSSIIISQGREPISELPFGQSIHNITQPFDYDQVAMAVNKILDQKNQSQVIKDENIRANISKDRIILHLSDGLQVINLQELNYCMSDRGYTTFYLSNGRSFTVSKTLKKFENLLLKSSFFRTHKSYFVNMNCIEKYDRNGMFAFERWEKGAGFIS